MAHGQDLHRASRLDYREDRRLIQDDASSGHVHHNIGRAEIDSQVLREGPEWVESHFTRPRGRGIASRLEGLAEPGAVVISGTVHEYVRAKVDLGFDDLWFQEVKNIAEPVHA